MATRPPDPRPQASISAAEFRATARASATGAPPWSNAQKTPYRDVMYASKAEANRAATLDLRVAAGEIRSWERAPSFPLIVYGQRCGRYRPDFLVTHNDGSEELLEVKGRAARDFALRLNVFRACYPGWRVSVIDEHGQPWKPRPRRRRA